MEEERFLEALFGGRCALAYFVGGAVSVVRVLCLQSSQRNFMSENPHEIINFTTCERIVTA